MTDEQLAVYLIQVRSRLCDAIESINSQLDGCDVERHKAWRFRGTEIERVASLSSPEEEPDLWYQEETFPVLLNELNALHQDIGISINALLGGGYKSFVK